MNNDKLLREALMKKRIIPREKLTKIFLAHRKEASIPLDQYLIIKQYITIPQLQNVLQEFNLTEKFPFCFQKTDNFNAMFDEIPTVTDKNGLFYSKNTESFKDIWSVESVTKDMSILNVQEPSKKDDLAFFAPQEPSKKDDLAFFAPTINNYGKPMFSSSMETLQDSFDFNRVLEENKFDKNDLSFFAPQQQENTFDKNDLSFFAPQQQENIKQSPVEPTLDFADNTNGAVASQENFTGIPQIRHDHYSDSFLKQTPSITSLQESNEPPTLAQPNFLPITPPQPDPIAPPAPSTSDVSLQDKKLHFGKAAILLHYLTQEDVEKALNIQKTISPNKKIGEIMIEENMLPVEKVELILERQVIKPMTCKQCDKTYQIILYQVGKNYTCKICKQSLELVTPPPLSESIMVKPISDSSKLGPFIGLTQEIPLQVNPQKKSIAPLDFVDEPETPPTPEPPVFELLETHQVLEQMGINLDSGINLRESSIERPGNYRRQSRLAGLMPRLCILGGFILIMYILFRILSGITVKEVDPKTTKSQRNRRQQQKVEIAQDEKKWNELQKECFHIDYETASLDQLESLYKKIEDFRIKYPNSIAQNEAENELTKIREPLLKQRQQKEEEEKTKCINELQNEINRIVNVNNILNSRSANFPNYKKQLQQTETSKIQKYPAFKDDISKEIKKAYETVQELAKQHWAIKQKEIDEVINNRKQYYDDTKNLNYEIESFWKKCRNICHIEKNQQLEDIQEMILKKEQEIYTIYWQDKWNYFFISNMLKSYSDIKKRQYKNILEEVQRQQKNEKNEDILKNLVLWEHTLQHFLKFNEDFKNAIDNTPKNRKKAITLSITTYGRKKTILAYNLKFYSDSDKISYTNRTKNNAYETHFVKDIGILNLIDIYQKYRPLNFQESMLFYLFLFPGRNLSECKDLEIREKFTEFQNQCLIGFTLGEIDDLCNIYKVDTLEHEILKMTDSFHKRYKDHNLYIYCQEYLAKKIKKYIQTLQTKVRDKNRILKIENKFNPFFENIQAWNH